MVQDSLDCDSPDASDVRAAGDGVAAGAGERRRIRLDWGAVAVGPGGSGDGEDSSMADGDCVCDAVVFADLLRGTYAGGAKVALGYAGVGIWDGAVDSRVAGLSDLSALLQHVRHDVWFAGRGDDSIGVAVRLRVVVPDWRGDQRGA